MRPLLDSVFRANFRLFYLYFLFPLCVLTSGMAEIIMRAIMNDIEYLRREKERRGVSYETMAREIGVSMRTLFRWLHRQSVPSLMGQEKILTYANTTRERLG